MLGDSEPVGVAISHARPDHVGALAEIRAKPGVPVLTHLVTGNIKAGRWLEEGDLVEVGDQRLWVRPAPDHSDDRVCYGIEGENRVIVGDASRRVAQGTLRHLRPSGSLCERCGT